VERSELDGLAAGLFEVGADADTLLELSEYLLGTLDELQGKVEPATAAAEGRDPGRRPSAEEDPLNAIVRWCRVSSLGEGLLDGARVAVKDSMAIGAVPLSCGSRVLDGYVPGEDSVVVERLLRAGAEIVAVTNMDNFAFSGGGDTSDYGSVLNPFDRTRTAGGSSGGAAAALHYEAVDLTVGTDQGGSIRVPAAWCGVLGLKPTFGLVPYTGILGIDRTIDHAGPMARDTTGIATTLQAIAGEDPSDQRRRPVQVEDYVKAVERAPDSMASFRLGVVTEGLDEAVGIEPEVREAFWQGVERMREAGATITEVSVPEHVAAGAIAFAGFIEGMTSTVDGGGNGYQWTGRYSLDLPRALGRGIAESGDLLPEQVKIVLLLGRHLRRHYHGEIYAQAQSQRPRIVAGYDRALAPFDALLLPTSPTLPHRDDPAMPVVAQVQRGWGTLANTYPTDVTGHPALSIPAAEAGGLPVGLMLIGRHDGEAKLLEIARAYEARYGWLPEDPPGMSTGSP
jgi:amidase